MLGAVDVVVFSRDRACQLDLLLRSLELNDAYDFGPPTVIYRATDLAFRLGYYACEAEHPRVVFAPEEDDLPAQVRSLVGGRQFVVFLTDDDVLFGWSGVSRPSEILAADERMICFSLRLGLNTTRCYPYRRAQAVPTVAPSGEAIVWEWAYADGDFGYPMSLDGHVFRSSDLLPLLDGARYANPNGLEDILTARGGGIDRPLMAAYATSRLVGIPANRVNETHGNRYGETHSAGAGELNDRYLAGGRIDLDRIPFEQVAGAHHELPYPFA